MNMQDKDMDQLFRSKLDSYEVQPSARVWANISNELGGEKQRKSIVPMLRIAASVVVVVSAGLFFLTKKQNNVEQPVGKKQASIIVKPEVVKAATTINQPTPVKAQVKPIANTQSVQVYAAVNRTKVDVPVTKAETKAPVDQAPQLVQPNPITQPVTVLAAIDNKPTDNRHAMPDGPIVKPIDVIGGDNLKGEVLADAATADDDIKIPAKKRKATGLGGFLNKVIAAVDKRDDKIIEFTDTDEGDAITGINLGIFKVKKQK